MNKSFYARLTGYCSAMAQAGRMLRKGLVSAADFAVIETIMAEKYGLSSCSLFREHDLLYKEADGNIVTDPKRPSGFKEVTICRKRYEK